MKMDSTLFMAHDIAMREDVTEYQRLFHGFTSSPND